MLPSQAGEHQLIRLPGQTRVSPEEYKEFLGLGHGDVFDLDPDRYLCTCRHEVPYTNRYFVLTVNGAISQPVLHPLQNLARQCGTASGQHQLLD